MPLLRAEAQDDPKERAEQLRAYQNKPVDTLSDRDKRTLIQWAENAQLTIERVLTTNAPPLGEAFGQYYIDLIVLITRLHDPKAIGVLVNAVDISNSVGSSLAEFGDPAVEPVIRVLSKPHLAEGAVYALGKFVEGSRLGKNRLSPQSLTRIRRELLRMTRDNSPEVRIETVRALAFLDPDQEILGTLERIASSDPAHRTREIEGVEVYPVRQAARDALQKIRK